ncbi:hypothetical protein P6166_14565 [Stenotrophomonas sp. HITSZ_GD]|uniref:hypothetical protein n=1 Tax=Stenotrophomonas sp. HITSZ_GD TaxID=3037248 RepID=UPI00240E0330|nr:hypothetical protein [Stenotrophomonas sp. HITSZ_GD]MDG2526577.1 hypothetical protein [Stenotrophomonas sp. HITSZ_GD]
MTTDAEIIADMVKADEIKSAAPGSAVSADAVFLALRLGARQKPRKYHSSDRDAPAPEWFADALVRLKGLPLTIGSFALLAGRGGAPRGERYAIGRWLRASGREPYKCGGELRFRI